VDKFDYAVRLIAISKMMDVEIISAEFNEYPVVFEPWVLLLHNSEPSVELFGAYIRGFEKEKSEPDICIRYAFWSRDKDQKQYEASLDKRAYVLSDSQMQAKTVFGTVKEYQNIYNLADEIERLVVEGFKLQPCNRDDRQNGYFRIKIMGRFETTADLDLSYNPRRLQNRTFEEWTNRWRAAFQSLDFNSGKVPEHGTRISYTMSFPERLEMIKS
jgi:hypothetical protein